MIFGFAKDGFEKCIADARSLIISASILSINDQNTAIRGSLMLVVGAFDFFIHEVIRVETARRVASDPESVSLQVPLSVTARGQDRLGTEIDLLIRKQNSFRSFVGSANLKDCFSSISINIWPELEKTKGLDIKETRKRLDTIWRWRNRIAHEGDLVPSNSSFTYWSIYSEDAIEAADFLESLAKAITDVLENLAS
ncbi:HEPN domain-containing protein [Seohaeicola zhoushanensis]|uniref:HEPN domain-containing protein n=1 Tax=Seohaeicola zhoushanensis TaxID=1569283 RepID=UPI00227D711E|nr:HEPN domain-containing protein [Seohaeicola zhoushanensis]